MAEKTFRVAAAQASPVFLDRSATVEKACGQIIAGPLEAEEGLVIADVDLTEILTAKRMFDVAGHYARPDVFDFVVRR